MSDLVQIQALLIALGCGLLIGAERERRNATRATRTAAGLRTFAIAGLGGAIAMIAGGAMLLVLLLLAIAAFVAASRVRERDPVDPGVTTELALVATVLLGGLAVPEPLIAGAAALGIALVPCAAAAVTALGLGALFAARGFRDPAGAAPQFGQSLRIVMALGFAVMLATMLVAVAALRTQFGATGLIAGALLGGVIDVHAASIAIATQVADGALTPDRAALPLLLVWSSSSVAKLVLAIGAGPRRFGLRVVPGLSLILGAAWLAASLRGFG